MQYMELRSMFSLLKKQQNKTKKQQKCWFKDI